MVVYLVSLISVLLGSVAQYLFKVGVGGQGKEYVLIRLTHNPYIWLGLVCYGISLLLWFYVLSQLELSKAYPLVGIGYVFTLIIGYCFLGESLNAFRIAGVFLIVCGVFLVAKS